MGIQLSSLISGKEIDINSLANRRVAVDAFNWIYQFLTTIRGADGNPLQNSRGDVTSHLSGLFYRNINLLEADVKLIYVFDGKPPHFKAEENQRRHELKKEAIEKWQDAVEKGDVEQAIKFAKRTATIDQNIIDDSKELLNAMGICVIQAPSEGEALASLMAANNDAWCVATQDFDSLLFGAPRLARNLSISGKRKYMKTEYVTVNPEIIELKDVLKNLELSRDQLIILGMLIGTDYNQGGIKGIGPKKALDIVKKECTLDNVLANVNWSFSTPAQEIFDFFKHPCRADYNISFPKIDEEKIRKLLCDKHEFSSERVENGIKRLRGEGKKKAKKHTDDKEQQSLGKWIKK